MRAAALAVRFLVELAALALFAYWGATGAGSGVRRTLLAVGAPLAVALLWGALIAPRARVRVAPPLKSALALAVFLAAAAALASRGHGMLALAFGVIAAINAAMLLLLEPGGFEAHLPMSSDEGTDGSRH